MRVLHSCFNSLLHSCAACNLQAFMLGAAMRPRLAEQLVAADPASSAAAAQSLARRPGPSMQELEKLETQSGGNATVQQDDGFIMPLFTARELLTLREGGGAHGEGRALWQQLPPSEHTPCLLAVARA